MTLDAKQRLEEKIKRKFRHTSLTQIGLSAHGRVIKKNYHCREELKLLQIYFACVEAKTKIRRTSENMSVCLFRAVASKLVSSSLLRPCHWVCAVHFFLSPFHFFFYTFQSFFSLWIVTSNIFFFAFHGRLLVLFYCLSWCRVDGWWSSIVIQPHTRLDTC